jgi:uncharacterized glyoxalase superfamily protein PhnB
MTESVQSQVEVNVDRQTAFRAFTEEMNLWWVRGPINFYDAARAVAKVCEPGVGGRLLEVYPDDDVLEIARITVWEPGSRLAWQDVMDDVRTEVTFEPTPAGTLVRVTATIPDGGTDRGGTAYVRVAPQWFGRWCDRRETAPREPRELARLAVAVYYPEPAVAARWLADAFGLSPTTVIAEEGGWIEFHVGNASLLIFSQDNFPERPVATPTPKTPTHVPWIYVDDLDSHFAHAVSRGAEIVEGIHQHGFRAYVARDPYGHTWTIAQAPPGMS